MPASHSGMGAIPYAGGVAFRVWAPFALAVHVAGDFNAWNATSTPLVAEGNGHWLGDVPGASVGQKYKFIVGAEWRLDPRAKEVTSSVGDGIITESAYPWAANNFTMPPWNELVIYEMHAATFPDGPVSSGELFDAVIEDLWYLKELGVNAIELLPMSEFPGDFSWGYNPANIFAIESSYGGPAGLKRLIDAAHREGIAVIPDVVYNHFGPDDLPMWQFDGWLEYWDGQAMGGIYFYNDWRAWTPWGSKNRPDYGRPEVRRFIRDNALMWLEEYRADGLRVDATSYIRNVWGRNDVGIDDPGNLSGWGWNLLRWINDEVNGRTPWKIMIAEDMHSNPWITGATGAGGAGFDSQWDAEFHHAVRRVLIAVNDEDRDMGAIATAITRRYNEDALQRVIYTESHDEVAGNNGKRRLTEDIHPGRADSWEAKKRSTLGAALVLTSPGIPMLFQGQEILEWIPFGDKNRIDWDKYDRFRGIFTLYRDLVRLRRNWFNNTRGLQGPHTNVFHVNHGEKVVGFHRWQNGGPGDDVIVVLNFKNTAYTSYTIGLPRPGTWYLRFNSDWSGYAPDFGHPSYDATAESGGRDGLPCSGNVGLGPYSAVVLSQ
jgi:1,4-alpha-glucan branching enzyme